MNTPSLRKLILSLAILFVLLACTVPELPLASTPNPTPNPGAVQTIVVATAGAAQTQTALVVPSPTDTLTSTPTSTFTPTDTPTATETFILSTATKPPTATEPFATKSAGTNCQLVSQIPSNDTSYDARTRFTAEWTLRNTGSVSWSSGELDFFYSSGTDMSGQDVYDLPSNVGPDGEVTFQVAMRAPGKAGTYTSTWSLGKKNKAQCEVSIRIIVK